MPASPIEIRMAHLEGAYEQVSQRLTSIDLRFDAVDRRFDILERKIDSFRDALDKRIDAVDAKIDQLRNALDAKIDQRCMWTIGVVVTTWLTTIASIYLRH